MRLLTLALLGLLTAASASAQTGYSRLASQAELADQGRFPGVQPTCIKRTFGVFYFFDDTADQILAYDPDAAPGVRTSIVISAAALDATAGTNVTQCRDMDGTTTRLYFVLSNAADQDVVIDTGTGGGTGRLLSSGAAAAGITGVIAPRRNSGVRIFVSRSQSRGAPEDGIYEIGVLGAPYTVTPIFTNPDLDLVGLAVSEDSGDFFATSSENGTGLYRNKILRLVSPLNGPALQIVADPFAGPNPLFANGNDGGLEDLFVDRQGTVERIFVMNNSFSAPLGETLGRYNLDGSSPVLVFTQAGLIASPAAMATPTSAFTPAGENGYLTYGTTTNTDGTVNEIFLASTSSDNGQTAIFRLDVGSLPTPGEETAAADAGFSLSLANPIRGTAHVQITQPAAADVRVSVVDVLGREVAVLADGARAAVSDVQFDTAALSPGTYVVVARSGGYALSRTVTVVR